MSALDAVLLALGHGDTAKGIRLASVAIAAALPVWIALAILLAMGPGR